MIMTALLAGAAGAVTMGYGFFTWARMRKAAYGSGTLPAALAELVQMAYNRQNLVIAILLLIAALTLGFGVSVADGLAVALGGLLAALVGFAGRHIAVEGAVRTAHAASDGIAAAYRLASATGTAASAVAVGSAVLSFAVLSSVASIHTAVSFAFGSALAVLAMRTNSSIFNKVGDQLGGMLKIPSMMPIGSRDAVARVDAAGDIAGGTAVVAAETFETIVMALAAASLLGSLFLTDDALAVSYPLALAAAVALAALAGYGNAALGRSRKMRPAFDKSLFAAGIAGLVASYLATRFVMDATVRFSQWDLVVPLLLGIVACLVAVKSIHFFIGGNSASLRAMIARSMTPQMNVLAGIVLGAKTMVVPALALIGAIFVSYFQANMYGVALCAMGMLAFAGAATSFGIFGAVADAAKTVAELEGADEAGLEAVGTLDRAGNGAKAVSKAFYLMTSTLVAMMLFVSYILLFATPEYRVVLTLQLDTYHVLTGLLFGALLPFAFGGALTHSLALASEKALAAARANQDHVGITRAALKAIAIECWWPLMVAVLSPVGVLWLGFVFSSTFGAEFGAAKAMGAVVMGAVATGGILAWFGVLSGSAWDAAKKFCDRHPEGQDACANKATETGDALGDVLKDVIGPAIGSMVKLLALAGVLMIGLFAR